MRSMKAARLHRYDAPLEWDDVPVPVPSGPSDVIVRVGAAGVCRTDLNIIAGMIGDVSAIELPYTLGHEIAGWVHDVGEAVTTVAVGDAVAVHPLMTCGLCRACRGGDDMHCSSFAAPGFTCDGGFAEFVRSNERGVLKLPDGVSPQAAAALTDAGLTAYHAVKKAARVLRPGTTVLVSGIGGLGHAGVQCLRALTAADIIAVDPSPGALALAQELGADHAVLADGAHVQAIRDLTGGRGVDAILDFAGKGGAIDDNLAVLADHGTLFQIGYGDELRVPALRVAIPEISIVGNYQGTFNELEELLHLSRRGDVTLHHVEYAFADVNVALADLAAGKIRGRAVLLPG